MHMHRDSPCAGVLLVLRMLALQPQQAFHFAHLSLSLLLLQSRDLHCFFKSHPVQLKRAAKL